MFGFFKKRENGLKKIVFLLEQVFLEANEAFLLKEVRDDVFAKIQLGFNGSFNIFFTEKAALYEKQIPKMNTTFRNIKVQDKKGSYSDLEITVIDNLVAGLKFSNSNFAFYNISLINIGSMQKINKCIEDEYIIKKLTIFGFDMLNIPFCEIYEVKIKNKEYLLIVSKTAPNIEKMEKYGVKGTAEIKKYDIFLNNLKNGMKMRFKVALNPVKSLSRGKEKGRGRPIPLVSVEYQMNFLYERSEKNGFKLEKDEFTIVNRQHKILNKNQNIEKRKPLRLAYVEYEGLLEISDADKFRKTLTEGIGKKKAYGFGMMTVIPI